MENVTGLLAFLAALSLATERITEVIKGTPLLSRWFVDEKAGGWEEARKASIQVLAILIGTILTRLTQDQLPSMVGLNYSGGWICLLFGAMASGGSGIWNSALDIVREVNKQKQVLTEKLKK